MAAQPKDFAADAGFDPNAAPTDGGFMRGRTALLLAVMAVLLAACAGPTGGMGRAVPPAHATGEGIATTSSPSAGEPAASSGHEHHPQEDKPHVH